MPKLHVIQHRKARRIKKRMVNAASDRDQSYAVGLYRLVHQQEAAATPRVSLNKILLETATEFEISYLDLISHRRQTALCQARHKAMWRMRGETSASLPEIGRALGRDHTTVIHGIRKHEQRLADKSASCDLQANISRCIAKGLPDLPAIVIPTINNHSQ